MIVYPFQTNHPSDFWSKVNHSTIGPLIYILQDFLVDFLGWILLRLVAVFGMPIVKKEALKVDPGEICLVHRGMKSYL